MSVFDRMSEFLVDHVMPKLAFGTGPKNVPSREDIEREAERELQARISMGRPGPEESIRRKPRPEWAIPRPRPTRRLEVTGVRLDVLMDHAQAPSEEQAMPKRRRLIRQAPSR